MSILDDVRKKYPQYNDIPDAELADKLYSRFYSDMPRADYNKKLGLDADPAGITDPKRSAAQEVARKAGYAGAGLNDSLLETVGALPDAVASGMRAIGLPAPEAGFYTNKLKAGWAAVSDALGKPTDALMPGTTGGAMTTGDKIAYGAGHGAGDAASVALPAAAVARTTRAGTLVNGVADALAAQPVTQAISGAAGGATSEATGNPLLGAAASMAVPVVAAGAMRGITPVRSQLTQEQARLAAQAEREGIDLTAAQATGSRPLQIAESVFGSLPLTAGPQAAIQQAQRDQFNRAVLSRAGVNANAATPEVLDTRFRELGDEFRRLIGQTGVNLDAPFNTAVDDAIAALNQGIETHQRHVAHGAADTLRGLGPSIAGDRYQALRSDLGKLAKANAEADPPLARALRGLQSALDDAAGRSAADQDAWHQARQEYANLKTIARAASSGTPEAVAGNIPPAQLAAALRQSVGRDQFARGSGELNDLARIGQSFVRQPIPNSGTSERAAMTGLLTGSGAAGAGAMVAGADPVTALGGTLATLALPRAAQAAYNSAPVQAYLRNRLAATAGPTVDRALIASLLAADTKREATKPRGLLSN